MRKTCKVLFLSLILLVLSLTVYNSHHVVFKHKSSNLTSTAILVPGTDYCLLKKPSANSEVTSSKTIPGGNSVLILNSTNNWVMVEVKNQTGWIPKWFLTEEKSNKRLITLNSDYMVVNNNHKGVLYPYGSNIVNLEKGNLVKPLLQWNDWVQVYIIQFSIPSVSKAWIKENALSTPSEILPNQGFLRVGTKAYEVLDYNDIISTKPEDISYLMPVDINDKHGIFTNVSGPGGWIGWVKTMDITSQGDGS